MDVIVDNVKKEEITFEDFPFICRICLLRGDLISFKEFNDEEYLVDLFMSITQIDVHSTIDFPRNICNSCVNKLEDIKDISLSIEIWKDNSRMKKEKEEIEDLKVDMMPVCIICSSRCNLMSFEENGKLTQLFRNITNIDVKDELASSTENGICSGCIDKLEDITSFINLSLSNDGKLEYAVGRKKYVKCETHSDAIGINSSTSNGLKLEDVADYNEAKKENPFEKTMADEIEEKQVNIDINNLFPKQESLCIADEELSQYSQWDWSNKDSTHTSNSRRQMLTNTMEKFKCDYCEKSFNQKVGLHIHLRTHTGKNPLKCDICDKSFSRGCNLRTHLRIHTGEKPFKCDCCQKSFSRKVYLNRHLRTHTGEKPFKCDCCEKSFSQKTDLKQHLRTHTGEKPFKCDICDNSFTQGCSLRTHMLIHTGEKPFECDYCKKSFTKKSDLKIHLRTHTGEKPFKCDICDKTFTQGSRLRTHMLTHTGEKPFKCDICDKSFRLRDNFRRHKLIHTGEKPFKCDYCERSFNRECNLRIHLRTHTGEKPFKCDSCGKSFNRELRLKNHLRTHTGEKPFKCDISVALKGAICELVC